MQLCHVPWCKYAHGGCSEADYVTSLSTELEREAHGGFFHTGQGTAMPRVPVPPESLWRAGYILDRCTKGKFCLLC